MELHNCLREERVQRDLTQVLLADAVGVTRQTIIAIEKGKFVPSVKLALELAGFLRLPLESLFWLEEAK